MSEPTVADYAQVGLAFGLLRRSGLKEEIDAMGGIPQKGYPSECCNPYML
jgi:hypothetical protein